MPSRTLALALVAMVLPSGCSTFGGGSDPATTNTTADSPDFHGFAFVSPADGEAFEATVAVEKDGEQLLQRRVTGDGNGTYANLSAVDEPGPYTVTVNTTITGYGDGNMSERVQVDGSPGNQTVVDVSRTSISFDSVSLPRKQMAESVYVFKGTRLPSESTVVVRHRGEVVYSGGVPEGGVDPYELTVLPETGVYRVAVSGLAGENWRNDTVVVHDPESKLLLDVRDRSPAVVVYSPGRPLPENERASLRL